ncbi:MAG: FAD-dependent oxidoreductase [Candidatus Omnitrophica bacterium]|nr:FAD-dependent oxidoreductase [Candidatus Omnitrophota bacterium]
MEIVGIPKEIKPNEKRVGLTPTGVRTLTEHGARVLVQKDAGTGAGFTDDLYLKAGANIVSEARELWQMASIIQKVKEPVSAEFGFLRESQVLFCYLHLASQEQCALVKALVASGITAIGYETVEVDGSTPLLKPMSQVAGTLAGYYAGIFRNLTEVTRNTARLSESGKKLVHQAAGRYPEIPKGIVPGKVVVLGGGQAGLAAAETAARMGGQVFLTEPDPKRKQFLTVYCREENVPIIIRDPKENVEAILSDCDVIVSAVHRAGNRAPVIISKEMLGKISRSKKKLIIDISIDQGGNVAESHSTTYDDPVYLDSFGNIRFAVANMPSICPKQASAVLEQATLKYSLALSEGFESALAKYPELETGINIRCHEITLHSVGIAHQYFS